MSLTASYAEEWACSVEDHDTLPSAQVTRLSVDSELIRALTKAVEDLSLTLLAPEEPTLGLLDEWSHQQYSRQWPTLFFQAVHKELTGLELTRTCRTTSALTNRAYFVAGKAGSAPLMMVVLQVFQAKLLHSMDESLARAWMPSESCA